MLCAPEEVVERMAERFTSGEFAKDAGNKGAAAGGPPGGTAAPPRSGRDRGEVSWDYEAVPRNIDVDAFR